MRQALRIADNTIEPGQRLTLDLPFARLYTHTEMTIPLHVIHSRKTGPTMFISAAIHGDEIVGVEIIRRLLQLKALQRLRGTLIAIPIVNVYGFLNQSRYSPDRRDLNRFFPGTETGSLTSRLAALFTTEIVDKCTHGIDLHTGSNHRANLPQIRAYLDNPETEHLACTFGAPVILDADLLPGSLRQTGKDRGVKMLLYEAGEVLRFDETAIRIGLRGIVSVMRAIHMLPPRKDQPATFKPIIARSSTWVRAPLSGLLQTRVRLGDAVKANAVMGQVSDPFGDEQHDVVASATGTVIGRLRLPLVHRGDALFHIARFESTREASATMQAFKQEFEPDG